MEQLYEVSVNLSGKVSVATCTKLDACETNTIYHVGNFSDYTMYCTKENIENTIHILESACRKKIEKIIDEKKEQLNSAMRQSDMFEYYFWIRRQRCFK